MNDQTRKVKAYYDSSQWIYKLFCYNGALSMHHGFWHKDTKTIQEAMTNEDQFIMDLAKINSESRVLDAGCGVGGTAIAIAKKTRANIVGVTLSLKQAKLAQRYAIRNNVRNNTEFAVQDYAQMDFRDNSFDVIYGIESLCHGYPKLGFLKEAFRLLKPGGILVIADGYTSRPPTTEKEIEITERFKSAFALVELITPGEMTRYLKKAGYIKIKEFPKIDEIAPSILHFHKLGRFTGPLIKISSYLPFSSAKALYKNKVASKCEYDGLKIGLSTYYVHYAEKPK